MNFIRTSMLHHIRCTQNSFKNYPISITNNLRHYCEYAPKVSSEKSINHVTLLGRVGINPQLRGSESKPVVVFTLATNTNYKYESGEMHQKTEWHRISVFKPHLRSIVLEYLKKGTRIYLEGRILYGEFSDSKGMLHNTTTIIANDIVFLSGSRNADHIDDATTDAENSMV